MNRIIFRPGVFDYLSILALHSVSSSSLPMRISRHMGQHALFIFDLMWKSKKPVYIKQVLCVWKHMYLHVSQRQCPLRQLKILVEDTISSRQTWRKRKYLELEASNWWPFGPPWLRPSRPSGAQAVWPAQWCGHWIVSLAHCLFPKKSRIFFLTGSLKHIVNICLII